MTKNAGRQDVWVVGGGMMVRIILTGLAGGRTGFKTQESWKDHGSPVVVPSFGQQWANERGDFFPLLPRRGVRDFR